MSLFWYQNLAAMEIRIMTFVLFRSGAIWITRRFWITIKVFLQLSNSVVWTFSNVFNQSSQHYLRYAMSTMYLCGNGNSKGCNPSEGKIWDTWVAIELFAFCIRVDCQHKEKTWPHHLALFEPTRSSCSNSRPNWYKLLPIILYSELSVLSTRCKKL